MKNSKKKRENKILSQLLKKSDPIRFKPNIKQNQHIINIPKSVHKIYMPYKPYSHQILSARQIYKSLQFNLKTVLYESPTGTGKTQVSRFKIISLIKGALVFYFQFFIQTKTLQSKSKKKRSKYFSKSIFSSNLILHSDHFTNESGD